MIHVGASEIGIIVIGLVAFVLTLATGRLFQSAYAAKERGSPNGAVFFSSLFLSILSAGATFLFMWQVGWKADAVFDKLALATSPAAQAEASRGLAGHVSYKARSSKTGRTKSQLEDLVTYEVPTVKSLALTFTGLFVFFATLCTTFAQKASRNMLLYAAAVAAAKDVDKLERIRTGTGMVTTKPCAAADYPYEGHVISTIGFGLAAAVVLICGIILAVQSSLVAAL